MNVELTVTDFFPPSFLRSKQNFCSGSLNMQLLFAKFFGQTNEVHHDILNEHLSANTMTCLFCQQNKWRLCLISMQERLGVTKVGSAYHLYLQLKADLWKTQLKCRAWFKSEDKRLVTDIVRYEMVIALHNWGFFAGQFVRQHINTTIGETII